LCALVARGGDAPERLPRRPRWLVVGGEAHGIPESWLPRCDERLTLPMPGGTESLNAAVAGAIACWLLLREPA
jgi:TrmH family RNA methyltransferase